MSYRYNTYGRRRDESLRNKVILCVVGGAVAIAVGLYIVEQDDADAIAVCTSADGLERVDDNLCGDYGDDGGTVFAGGYHFMIFDTRHYKGDVPAIGQKMPTGSPAGYVRSYPVSSGKVAQKVKKEGGKASTIQRGGFGVSSGSKGGSGS